MISVSVCIGTTCHINNWRIFYRIQSVLRERGIRNDVNLKADFCLGNCGTGPNVTIDGEVVEKVSPDRVEHLVDAHIVPKVKTYAL